MTVEGCAAARRYLLEINKYGEFINNKTSIDGYSLVQYANHYKKKEEQSNWITTHNTSP